MPGRRIVAGAMLAASFVGLAGARAHAHPPSIVNEAGERVIGDEVRAFRKAMAAAIAARDTKRLRAMYAPAFTHTHTNSHTFNRDARIASALAGDPLIETASATDLEVRAPNDWVAVVTGTSPLKSVTDGRTYAVRWIAVYTRSGKSWVLVVSQATRAGEIKP